MKKIVLYNPAISSLNIGDEIIAKSCKQNLDKIFNNDMYIEISTHLPVNNSYLKRIKDVRYSFVLGSNLLMPKLDARFRQWDIKMWNVEYMKPVILMGVGWNKYSTKTTTYTKNLYKRLLSDKYLHSVRDIYTEQKLKEIGINNVINTGCPSFWELTKEHCQDIPKSKSNKVVFTLTDYKRDFIKDKKLLEILKRNYKEVLFWIQGSDDYEYFKQINTDNNIQIIPPKLEEFDKILKTNVDYIGTRLHGGIRAIQHKCRSIILAVDNRATELNKNYNIPVIQRNDINNLEKVINNELVTDILLPSENIERWKKQFMVKEG